MLDTLELMAQRADELEQTYDNNVMIPGLPKPGALSFKTEPGLPVPYTGGGSSLTPIQGQLIHSDDPVNPLISQAQGSVAPGNEMTLAELDQVYDQATEEVLDALFLIDEDLNSGLDILSNSITTYNGKSMRLQIQQRDLLKDMSRIFRDWWEVTERERNKPEALKLENKNIDPNADNPQVQQTTVTESGGGGGSLLDDLFGGGDNDKKDDGKDDKRNKRRRAPRGKFGKLLHYGKSAVGGALDFFKSNTGKLALGAGAGYLAYNAYSDNSDSSNVMTPEQIAERQASARTGTLMDPETGEPITWEQYDAKYGQTNISQNNSSTGAVNASTTTVLQPGQASIPSSISEVSNTENNEFLSPTQMIGAAGLTALGGATLANNMRNRTPAMPDFKMPNNSPDLPKAALPAPNANAKPATLAGKAKGAGNLLRKAPKLGLLSGALGAYDIYNTATDDTLTGREKTTGIADSAGQMGAYAATLALGPAAPFAMAALGISDAVSFAGGLMGYDIPSISGLVGDATSSIAGGVYDFFGFGDEATEENVQTAAALTSGADKTLGSATMMDDSELADIVPPTAKSEKITQMTKELERQKGSSSIPSIMDTALQFAVSPVGAVASLASGEGGLFNSISNIFNDDKAETKNTEQSFSNAIFEAAAMTSPIGMAANALYKFTDISNLFGDDVSSSQSTVDNSVGSATMMDDSELADLPDIKMPSVNIPKAEPNKDSSFFSSMMERVKDVSIMDTMSMMSPVGMAASLMTSPSVSSMAESVYNSIFGDSSEASTTQTQNALSQTVENLDTAPAANTVQVQPSTESSERSNFTTIKEQAAPLHEKERAEPVVVKVPEPKKEPAPRTKVVKQVIQPRPTIDDTPTLIGNGGLSLLGNTIA